MTTICIIIFMKKTTIFLCKQLKKTTLKYVARGIILILFTYNMTVIDVKIIIVRYWKLGYVFEWYFL